MEFQKDELNEILNIFQQESTEIITAMDGKLLILEKDPKNYETAMQLFRDAHSLKGSARMLGFEDIQNLAHKIEDIISLIKEQKLEITTYIADVISECLEFILILVNKTVSQKKEFKSPDLDKYIEKLESLARLEQEKQYVNINCEIEPSQKEFLINFDNIENIIVEMLYIVSYSRLKNNFDKIFELDKNIENFNNLISKVNDEKLNDIKTSISNISKATEKFSLTDNKALSFLEINECVNNFITNFSAYVDNQNFKRKDYYEEVEKRLQNEQNKSQNQQQSQNQPQPQSQPQSITPNIVSNAKFDELIDKISLLEHTFEFFDEIIEQINALIHSSNNETIKQIYQVLLNILKTHKSKNINLKQDLILGIKEVLNAIKSNNQEEIKEAKIKIDVFDKMSNFQNSNLKTQSSTKLNENQKDIFSTITNTEIKTLRVDSDKLDNLVSQIGELIVSKIKTNEQLLLVKKINNDLIDWQKHVSKMSYYIKYFDKKYLSNPFEHENDFRKIVAHNKQLSVFASQHNERLSHLIKDMSYLFKQLQESETKLNSTTTEIDQMVKNMRVLPMSTIFALFPRMVHNIARDKNKKIDLIINGADITADKTIIEELKIPLMHIIRNAIDHGIEDPQKRKEMGKNPTGKIEINASYKDGKVIVDVTDDGRGLDIEKIKAKALEKQILTKAELDAISDEEITNLIFYPGFSTEDFVTELSGRGLGLDIVNNKITHMQGRIDIFSQLNRGTMVRVMLPATVATKKVFIIEEQNQLFAIETSAIKTIVRINSDEIFEKDNHNYCIYNNNAIMIHTLSQILNFENTPREASKYTLLIIETENATFGIIVEKLISDQEIVHKKLAAPLYKVKHISGITTLANGEACLVLSLSDIIATINSKKVGTKIISKNGILKTKDNYKYKIMVVDDSHTTRILQKNILFNYGYNVSSATNPIHALEKMKTTKFDLIISDVQMPEMTGIEFVRHLRNTKEFKDIPVIIVSSEPKEHYIQDIEELNITDYIQKNLFSQNDLINKIESILNY